MRRHGVQAQGGAQADAMKATSSTRFSTPPRRASGVSPGAFTLFTSFSTSAFN
jgi:hypothetical protein